MLGIEKKKGEEERKGEEGEVLREDRRRDYYTYSLPIPTYPIPLSPILSTVPFFPFPIPFTHSLPANTYSLLFLFPIPFTLFPTIPLLRIPIPYHPSP